MFCVYPLNSNVFDVALVIVVHPLVGAVVLVVTAYATTPTLSATVKFNLFVVLDAIVTVGFVVSILLIAILEYCVFPAPFFAEK